MELKGCVIAVGGAEDKIKKRAILSHFVKAAGGKRARIVVIPAASMIPLERGELYANIFTELGVASVEVVHIDSREQAIDTTLAERVAGATGIFVTGGVQLRLVAILGGTPLATAIFDVVKRGGVYCGTSAGAAVVSSHMIVTGRAGMRVRRGMVDLAPGLGLVSGVIVDQHFSQRGRFGRLIAAVGVNPQLIGIGVDEDTGVVFSQNGDLEVIGAGQVVIVDASKVTKTNVHTTAKSKPLTMFGLQLHLLTEGDRFHLAHRLPSEAVARVPRGKKG